MIWNLDALNGKSNFQLHFNSFHFLQTYKSGNGFLMSYHPISTAFFLEITTSLLFSVYWILLQEIDSWILTLHPKARRHPITFRWKQSPMCGCSLQGISNALWGRRLWHSAYSAVASHYSSKLKFGAKWLYSLPHNISGNNKWKILSRFVLKQMTQLQEVAFHCFLSPQGFITSSHFCICVYLFNP